MSNCVAFQTQLAKIMEVLAEAAVAEISKLVDSGSVLLHLEVSRSHKEIDGLRKKLQQMERELRTAREATAAPESSVGVLVEEQLEAGRGALEDGADAGKRSPFEPWLSQEECDVEAHNTQAVFGFTVKAEHEEEHVAQSLNQTGCEHSAGRLNNLGCDYVMCERDSQLWTSFTQGDSDIETDDPVCSNATEQFSQSLSVHTERQHATAAVEGSGNTQPSLGKPVNLSDGVLVKEEASGHCPYGEENSFELGGEKNRSEMGGTKQTQYRQHPLSMRDNLTLQLWPPLQQPSDWHTGVSERITDPNSFIAKKTRIHWRAGKGEKPYSCTQCGKSFDRCLELERHKRIHTGEKPFSCVQCGKRFSQRGNLITHERVHSGNKPFGCAQCGKRFAQGSSLKVHQRIHTGERPYHCARCGKSFTQLSSFKTHQNVHIRNELLQNGMN